MKKLKPLFAVFGMVLAFAPAAQAQVITSPQDGYEGPYRLGFYTADTTPATNTAIAYYNAFITTAAGQVTALNALTGLTWKCIGSTTNVDARDNTGTNPTNAAHADVPIYNLDGVRIAHGNAGLWEAPWTLDAPFTDQWGVAPNGEGTDVPPIKIFTGTQRDGTKSFVTSRYYLGWKENALTGTAGSKMDIDFAFANFSWIISEGNGQLDWSRLLALSSVITGGPVGTIVEIK